MTSPPRYVFDSFALLAFFQDEPGAGQVERLLDRLRRGEIQVTMATVNLGEVVYRTIRKFGEDRVEPVLLNFSQYPIQLVDVDRDLAIAGAAIKGTYKMSYADCIAAALAQRLDAPVLTGDPEFERVEHFIRIEWLPRRQ